MIKCSMEITLETHRKCPKKAILARQFIQALLEMTSLGSLKLQCRLKQIRLPTPALTRHNTFILFYETVGIH